MFRDCVLEFFSPDGKLSAAAKVSRSAPDAPYDLGEIRLAEPAPLVGGVVVDDRGIPVAAARVTARLGFLGFLTFPVSPTSAGRLRTVSDSSGAFFIPEWPFVQQQPSPDRYPNVRLDVASATYIQRHPDEAFPSGTANVCVVMQRAGCVAGSIAVSARIPPAALSIRAEPDVKGGPKALDITEAIDSRGVFRITGLAPGRWTIQIVRTGAESPTRAIPNVEVRPHACTHDPRLENVDLEQP
jgi:hypothetical protein